MANLKTGEQYELVQMWFSQCGDDKEVRSNVVLAIWEGQRSKVKRCSLKVGRTYKYGQMWATQSRNETWVRSKMFLVRVNSVSCAWYRFY